MFSGAQNLYVFYGCDAYCAEQLKDQLYCADDDGGDVGGRNRLQVAHKCCHPIPRSHHEKLVLQCVEPQALFLQLFLQAKAGGASSNLPFSPSSGCYFFSEQTGYP